MEKKTHKPRLVFFQWDHKASPKFLQLHMQLHVKCLSEFFEVILINEDCDYQQICDLYQPDLTLFESGYRTSLSQKLNIKNTSAHPEIPKLGLHNGDPWCDCRIGFISDMDRWRIETFFSISTATAEHTPSIAENLFVWPNFIDSNIYQDYKQGKVIPVLFNGSFSSLYPWRQKIYKIISNYYPSLIFPHLGYESHSQIMIHGEQYARTINSSWFVPACGSVAKEIVRKHFEVPACKACLITERTPSLEAAGFVDMENCVFADDKNVVDKLDYLFKNQDLLQNIINAGYELVHSRHTIKRRDQIFQWFNLYKNLRPNQKIIQTSPFEPLYVVEKSSDIKNASVPGEGLDLLLLYQGDKKLGAGKYDEAEALYLKCLNHIYYMHEPKLKLAICSLYKGNAATAFYWITELHLNNFNNNAGIDPDPVEWAYLIISLLCLGKINEAIIRTNQFPLLHHPELDRTRWIIDCLQNKDYGIPFESSLSLKTRHTIHQLPERTLVDWVNNLCIMLKACRQFSYVVELSKLFSLKESSQKQKKIFTGRLNLRRHLISIRIVWLKKLSSVFDLLHISNPRPGLPSISEIDYIVRLGRCLKIDAGMKVLLKYYSRIKSYNKSSNDEFIQSIQNLLQKENIKTLIVIRSSSATRRVESIFERKEKEHNRVKAFYITINDSQSNSLKNTNAKYAKSHNDEFYLLAFSLLELSNCIKKIKEENEISSFDLLITDGFHWDYTSKLDELLGASFIVLDNINNPLPYKNKQQLVADFCYTIIFQNPMLHDGYAIFKKITSHSISPYILIQ